MECLFSGDSRRSGSADILHSGAVWLAARERRAAGDAELGGAPAAGAARQRVRGAAPRARAARDLCRQVRRMTLT